MEIFIDDAIIDDGQRAVKNANRDYNVGLLELLTTLTTYGRDRLITVAEAVLDYFSLNQWDVILSIRSRVRVDVFKMAPYKSLCNK